MWAGVAGLSDAELAETLDLWLAPLLAGKRRLSDIGAGALHNALVGLIGWDGQQTVERLAPAHFTSPAGTTHIIDYSAEAGPTVELRVQALFGLSDHPVVGTNRVPMVLSLTSPAGRAIQTTRDLPGFWTGSWADVAKDMRGRYPKHHWPDDPSAANASLKTKKRQGL
jgi:ATP-dependent helicase HrpB